MDAYKCDGCDCFFDGEPLRSRDLDLGDDFVLRFSVARKQEPPEGGTKPTMEFGAPKELMDGIMAALPFVNRRPDLLDGMELWAADLCPACTLEVLKRALVRAQTDSIAESLSESVGEFHE